MEKIMRVTLFSTFHPASVRLNIKETQIVMLYNGRKAIWMTAYQTKRADKALCGVTDCACGGVARARATDAHGQEYDVLS